MQLAWANRSCKLHVSSRVSPLPDSRSAAHFSSVTIMQTSTHRDHERRPPRPSAGRTGTTVHTLSTTPRPPSADAGGRFAIFAPSVPPEDRGNAPFSMKMALQPTQKTLAVGLIVVLRGLRKPLHIEVRNDQDLFREPDCRGRSDSVNMPSPAIFMASVPWCRLHYELLCGNSEQASENVHFAAPPIRSWSIDIQDRHPIPP